MYSILYLLPKNVISRLCGHLAGVGLPMLVRVGVLRAFVWLTGIKIGEAEKQLNKYHSIGELFSRRLKPGLRPVSSELTSPADGLLRSVQTVTAGKMIQVKGIEYHLDQLLLDSDLAALYEDQGTCFTFYLSPKDYHRVHSPVSGKILRAKHIPGELWPVNDWSLSKIKALFARNERLVIPIQTDQFGIVTVVMVGATNVGKMGLAFDENCLTNLSSIRKPRTFSYERPIEIEVGAELGTFQLGSTVLLFLRGQSASAKFTAPATEIRVGQDILHLL